MLVMRFWNTNCFAFKCRVKSNKILPSTGRRGESSGLHERLPCVSGSPFLLPPKPG